MFAVDIFSTVYFCYLRLFESLSKPTNLSPAPTIVLNSGLTISDLALAHVRIGREGGKGEGARLLLMKDEVEFWSYAIAL